jgi:hypothetical protein
MTEIVEEITNLLARNSVSVFGMMSASSLKNAPSGYRPNDMLESAESILCLGIPVPKGIFKCQGRSEWMYWRAANIYYRNVDTILMRVCHMIEGEGEVAVPIFG